MKVVVVNNCHQDTPLVEIDTQDTKARYHRVCITMMENDEKVGADSRYVLSENKASIYKSQCLQMLMVMGRDLNLGDFIVESDQVYPVTKLTAKITGKKKGDLLIVMHTTHGQIYLNGEPVMLLNGLDLYEHKHLIDVIAKRLGIVAEPIA